MNAHRHTGQPNQSHANANVKVRDLSEIMDAMTNEGVTFCSHESQSHLSQCSNIGLLNQVQLLQLQRSSQPHKQICA